METLFYLWVTAFYTPNLMARYRSYLPATPPPGSQRPPEIELIREMARSKLPPYEDDEPPPPPQPDDWVDPKAAFVMKPAAGWLRTTHPQGAVRSLFGNFWFEEEICILFADTNMGKSVLAVQIGQSIASGTRIHDFELNVPPSPVLYFDFELSQRQFEQRYSAGGGQNGYAFSPQFYRVAPNAGCTRVSRFASHAEFLNNGIENILTTAKARFLIIDNLNCLHRGTSNAEAAAELMRFLQKLRADYQLSILVLAHTPKRNLYRPISANDLQGSKMLLNFCDSAFALGESQTQPGVRYLKPIKQRSGPEPCGPGQVALYRVMKSHNNLCCDFMGRDAEQAHLQTYTEQQRRATEQQAQQLHQSGLSYRQISARLNVSFATVGRMLKRLEAESK